MGLFFNRGKNENTGLLAGLNAQITRSDVRNGGKFPVNTPMFAQPAPGQMPGQPPPGGDPRMMTSDAREAQQTVDRAGRWGSGAGFGGGLAGAAAGAALGGPFGAIIGGGAGAGLFGGLGQWLGGVKPDAGDVIGYGASGALGGLAGGAVSGLAGGAGGLLGRTLGTVGGGYAAGRMGLGAMGNILGINTEYDPRHRYFVNPNTRDIQSAY